MCTPLKLAFDANISAVGSGMLQQVNVYELLSTKTTLPLLQSDSRPMVATFWLSHLIPVSASGTTSLALARKHIKGMSISNTPSVVPLGSLDLRLSSLLVARTVKFCFGM